MCKVTIGHHYFMCSLGSPRAELVTITGKRKQFIHGKTYVSYELYSHGVLWVLPPYLLSTRLTESYGRRSLSDNVKYVRLKGKVPSDVKKTLKSFAKKHRAFFETRDDEGRTLCPIPCI